MNKNLLQVASQIRTPLTLASLTIIVLYSLYKAVLALNIFSVLGENNTFALINSIVDKVFYLALIALALGVAAYIITSVRAHRSKSEPRSSVTVAGNTVKGRNHRIDVKRDNVNVDNNTLDGTGHTIEVGADPQNRT